MFLFVVDSATNAYISWVMAHVQDNGDLYNLASYLAVASVVQAKEVTTPRSWLDTAS
jgi:hypothetical protein